MGALFGFKAWEFDLAFKYLRTKRKDGGIAAIAIISFIGIMLAVTALISVLSVMNGFRDEMVSRLLGFGGDVYVAGAPLNDFAHRDDMLKRIAAVPGVTQVTPHIDSPGLVQSAHGDAMPTLMRGVIPSAIKATPIIRDNIKGGSLANFGVGDYGGDTILMGDDLAQNLGVNPGDEVTLISPGGSTAFGAAPRRKVYTVGGLFNSGVSDIDRLFIYLPITQAQLFFDREDEWDQVEIKVKKPYEVESYQPAIRNAVGGQGALVYNWKEQNASMWGALKIERTAMRFILFFIVIIAMLNIISGIVMLVKNKTRDVAILRTMGADRAAILRIFFIAGTTIGALGTACGLIIGALFCTFIGPIQHFLEWVFHTKLFDPSVYYLDAVPAKMEPTEVAFVVIASFLAACVSTFFPALWASKLEPVEALRYE
ncbi:lipoprotein-releasing ABC transporter permease subunit [Asticcacaulis sp. 201]|uniref:lipoprotein-releasing ABC transporter permease subunit n=1 Tax=Asticcacaulis sp. 201 TaxID=3028787 RepID=UPI0029168663|nr:lipoprotein-releasing ABC transporter permease subunit [Asticcacaulis sp. 201]MDV6329304.1 lipoprotein-releasing ABC transporter permease subunit [Asticcacaulis sp. 201]